MTLEKKVIYTTSNTYHTLNSLHKKTKNVWLVFHGMGYLSKYFIKHFSSIDPSENFIIAPQAPSKYYQGTGFKHVGASWLTRENTLEDTKNILAYIDKVVETELLSTIPKLIVLGYSQGVSVATRWLSSRKISCDHLVLHSGGIPTELTKEDFEYLPKSSQVTYTYGDEDQYITEARKTEEMLKGARLFGDRLSVKVFNGVHEINNDFIKELAQEK